VFLDEPTSGLDSYSAVQLCQVLKKVANAGASVLFTIHQPSSDIFKSFDNLILMNKGRVMYQGPVEDVNSYFAARSNPVPPNYNPADWIMVRFPICGYTLKRIVHKLTVKFSYLCKQNVAQSINIKTLNEQGFFEADKRDMGEAFTPEDGKDALGITITKRGKVDALVDERPPGMLTQTRLLFNRELQNLHRDVTALGARFGLTIFLGTLIGVIFLNVGASDSSIPSNLQSHFGALVMVSLMSMFGTAQPALLSFPEERPVFLREYSTNHYSVVSYFISRLTMEATITAAQIIVQVRCLGHIWKHHYRVLSNTASICCHLVAVDHHILSD
jgi:ABC-2 type transporter